jgi:GH24 family phage-related lysozyme (muramidase)
MTEEEQKKLAKMIAEKISDKHDACPLGLTEDSAKALMDFAVWWTGIQRAGKFTFIGVIFIGFIAIFISGIIEKFGKLWGK